MKLKEYLSNSPILSRPLPQQPLLVYLTVTENGINKTLVQEIKDAQRPIYFVSKVLHGPEQRYQKIEKVALTVIVTARSLRHYFQSFNIIIKKISLSGRSSKSLM